MHAASGSDLDPTAIRTRDPREFECEQAIVNALDSAQEQIATWFAQRKSSLPEIVHHSVGSNTFRAFRKTQKPPSVVFRTWAAKELESESFMTELNGLASQKEFDEWISRVSDRFNSAWQAAMGAEISYGPRRKLPNLLLKELALWTGLDDAHRATLVRWLHVPLDKYTLLAMRNCVTAVNIPKSATMRFVTSQAMYDRLQGVIREFAAKAQVPPIYFDNLAWNAAH